MSTTSQLIAVDTARTRRQIAVAVILTTLGVAGAAFFFVVDPSSVVFLPRCPLYTTTGIYCPGCGATRALHELLRGHWLGALRLNALFTLSLPWLGVFGIYRWAMPDRERNTWKPQWTWVLLGMVVAFGVLRNIPVYPFTLLAP
jgi:hypothetical protein